MGGGKNAGSNVIRARARRAFPSPRGIHTHTLSLFRTRVRAHTHSERLNLNGRFYPIQAEGKAQLRITPGAVLSLWVKGLFEAPSVVSRAEPRRRQ